MDVQHAGLLGGRRELEVRVLHRSACSVAVQEDEQRRARGGAARGWNLDRERPFGDEADWAAVGAGVVVVVVVDAVCLGVDAVDAADPLQAVTPRARINALMATRRGFRRSDRCRMGCWGS